MVQIGLGDPGRSRWVAFDALVDTGASTTTVPGSILRELGGSPMLRNDFRFAQGEVRAMDIGQTWIRVAGFEFVTQVVFNDEGTTPLLGAMALEGAYMAVDPVGQRLIPVEGLLL